MIKINKNICIGTTVYIPGYLSWQIAGIAGRYTVVSIESDVYFLESINTGKKITIDKISLEYLLGVKTPFEYGVSYLTSEGFYPEESDPKYITDTESGLGFWYLGCRGKYDHISFSVGYYEKFFYVKYPQGW